MKILITGGSGFLGSAIANFYHKKGFNISCVDNLSRGKKENLDKNIKLYTWDISNFSYEFAKFINNEKPEYIYHLAAINGTYQFYERSFDVFDQNINMSYNLMVILEKCKYKPKVIYTSTSEVYNDPEYIPTPEYAKTYTRLNEARDSYSMSKLIGEWHIKYFCEKLGIDYVIFRVFNVIGKNDRLGHVVPDIINKIKNNDTIEIFGTGNETRSFCDIDDFVKMIFLFIEKDKGWNDVYNIGRPVETKIYNLIELIEKKLDKKVNKVYTKLRSGDHRHRCPDISKLENIIGKQKFLSLDESLDKIKGG